METNLRKSFARTFHKIRVFCLFFRAVAGAFATEFGFVGSPVYRLSFFCEGHITRAGILKAMDLRGKTREQLEGALRHKSRSELIDLIHSLVSVEQLLKPAEIASRSCLNKRAVLRDIRNGKFGDYFVRAENSICVPTSGVNQWRDRFACGRTKTRRVRSDLVSTNEVVSVSAYSRYTLGN
jgi:hypothetical protein